MPRYTLDRCSSDTFSNMRSQTNREPRTHLYSRGGDFRDVSNQKREFISSYVEARKHQWSGSHTGDNTLILEKTHYPWIEEGFDRLRFLESKNVSQGDGDDHFLQVLNAKAPNAVETAELLGQVIDLSSELEGRIRELSDFKDEIRQFGKLLKEKPLKQTCGPLEETS